MMQEQTQKESENTAPELPSQSSKEHHEEIYDILQNKDEITWRSIILELIKSEQMDPWNINISLLSKTFIKTLKKLKEMNLALSGKVLLAAALLLRIKSSKLVGDDMLEFDRLLASGDSEDIYSDEDFVEEQLGQKGLTIGENQMRLVPRTPQPRKRKVSVYDLIDALAVALNVKRRRVLSQIQTTTMELPEKTMDISELMDNIYNDVIKHLNNEQQKIAFSKLVEGASKKDKILTFVPLLHLTTARKLDLNQQNHFGEIWVSLSEKQQKTN